MKELVRGIYRTFGEALDVAYLDDEADELSNIEALRMIIYSQEDWEFRIRMFEPLRAKVLLDNLAEKQVYTCKCGPIARVENDNIDFFTHTGRFVWPRDARVIKREINILTDQTKYTVLTSDGEKRTIVL